MSEAPRLRLPWLGVLLWATLAVPPVAELLQARMQVQMLVQIPLLVVAGYLLRGGVQSHAGSVLARWNAGGVSGLLLATFTIGFWMLPRFMDVSTREVPFTVAKYVSLPLLAGLPLGLSWPRTGFVARGLVTMEGTAMCFRLGWLYIASPVRLCNSYLMNDQQLTGEYLVAVGACILLWVTGRMLCGDFLERPGDRQRRVGRFTVAGTSAGAEHASSANGVPR